MNSIMRKDIGNGIHFTAVYDPRFKQNLLSVNFFNPLKRGTAAMNSLLPMVLRRGCGPCPDMTALNRRLKELYGARLDGGVTKRGEIQIVSLFAEMLDTGYALEKEDMLLEMSRLLGAVVFDPVLENGVFRPNEVEIERRNLLDLIDSQLNDKRTYAVNRLREEMCKDEAYGVNELGRREDVPGITTEALTEAWRQMLSRAPVEIFIIGSAAKDGAVQCEALFQKAFASFGRGALYRCPTEVRREAGPVREVTETLPVAQAKLVMGLRAGVASPEDSAPAMQLCTTILGGSATSKFFLNVREKLSLCYYCMARYERVKGLLLFDAGIEQSNLEKARNAILAQLDDMQAGRFTDEELHAAALSLSSSYTSLADSLGDLNSWYLAGAVSGKLRAPAEAAGEILAITRQDVSDVAKKIRLDTVYFLASSGAGQDAQA